MHSQQLKTLLFQWLLLFTYTVEGQEKASLLPRRPSQTCSTTYSGNHKHKNPEGIIMLSYWEAQKMARSMNFGDLAEFWAWTRSDKRPLNFPRDPDSFYAAQWTANGDIEGFLNMSKDPRSVKQFMVHLAIELGGTKEASEYIINLFIKYNVTHTNSSQKKRLIPELKEVPIFESFAKHYPQLTREIQNRQNRKKWKSFSQFMNELEEAFGSKEKARQHVINLFVVHNVTKRNFVKKRQSVPDLEDFPHFENFAKHDPDLIIEVQRRQGKKNYILPVKQFMETFASNLGSIHDAREYIIQLFVKLKVTYHNFPEKQKNQPELANMPSFASFQKYDPDLIKEVQRRQGITNRVQTESFMKELAEQLGGIKEAKNHVIALFVEHNVTYGNFLQKRQTVPELKGFPHFSGIKRHYPEIIAQVLKRQGKPRRIRVEPFMRQLSEEQGGIEEAKQYIIELFAKHEVTYNNFAKKRETVPELRQFPHFASLKSHDPELAEEIQQKIKEQKTKAKNL